MTNLPPSFVRGITRVFLIYIRIFELILRNLGVALRIEYPGIPAPSSRLRDERIARIDVARANLQDALDALGDLKSEAEANKVELEHVMRDLGEAKAGHAAQTEQLLQIRAIAEADVATFRKMAGIHPTRDRFVGFVGGVGASLIAAGLWKLGEFLLHWRG
jgi:hypothetical protein